MRRKATKGSNRELSDKEKAWIDEVQSLANMIGVEEDGTTVATNSNEPWELYEEVKKLKDELLDEINEILAEKEVATPRNYQVSSEIRKAKMVQIRHLLDRESALVEGED